MTNTATHIDATGGGVSTSGQIDATPSTDPAGGDASTSTRAQQPAAIDAVATLSVAPRHHIARWVASAVVAVVVAQIVHGLVTNDAWDWSSFGQYFFDPSVMKGLWLTIRLAVLAAVFGFAGGVVIALMRQSKSPLLSGVAWTYTWVFRSIPLIVQVLLWGNLAALYRVLSVGVPFGPEFFEFRTLDLVSSFVAAVIALSMHEAAFASEVVRAGILSVDPGQSEAATALGIPRHRQFRRIVLPQAMRSILPNAVNQLVNLVKATSVVYILAIGELFYTVQVNYGRTSRVIPLLIVATVWYVVLTTALSIVQYGVERHFAKGATRDAQTSMFDWLRSLPVDPNRFRGATR